MKPTPKQKLTVLKRIYVNVHKLGDMSDAHTLRQGLVRYLNLLDHE